MDTSIIIAILGKVNKISLYAAVLLVPMFFLTLSQDFLEHPKHLFLTFALIVGLASWLLKQLLQGEIIVRKQAAFYAIAIILLLAAGISTAFSLWQNGSLWGWPLNIADGFIATAFFLVLACLLANSFDSEKELLFLLKLLTVSGAVVGIFTIFQTYNKFLLPFDFAKTSLFNIMGSISNVAFMAGALLPIALYFSISVKNRWKSVFLLSSLIFLATLCLVNFRVAWAILSLGLMLLMIFGIKLKKQINFIWAGVLMILLAISVFFLFFPLRLGFLPVVPVEVSPSIIAETNIIREAFKESQRNVFIGTGPGTFVFNYSKFRSPAVNQTVFWGNRFIRGNSTIFDWTITQGIFGGLALFVLIGWAACIAAKKVIKSSQTKEGPIPGTAFFASVFAVLTGSFFYSFNFVLWFIFWTYIGIILFYSANQKNRIDLKTAPHKTGIFVLASALILVVGSSAFIFQTIRYSADINYARAMQSAQNNKTDEAIAYLERATELNSKSDVYWRELAQLYLVKADNLSRDFSLTDDQRQQLVYNAVAKGTEAVNLAISSSPASVASWNVRGYFYRNLIPIQGADELALESYRRAIVLEPSSPFSYGEMGRVYILIAQDEEKNQAQSGRREEALALAIRNLNQALELKADYAPAHYLLAVVYDQQGKLDDAIVKLREAKNTSPQDVGVAFQLGLLYWRKQDLGQAEKEFKRSIELMPNYSNARYMLGLVYDQQGKKEQAIGEFKIVAQLNPDNQEVKKILEDLEKGLPAADIFKEVEEIIFSNPGDPGVSTGN